ncbi:ABC transporter ATP-binding protein [Evansella sp. AB-rgal1]|uniref:ABC transporter ATP-binding protein n=1 Tax=Evansella sp. AB-rgal1 TaxID=3242696 RepID=UPI00359CEAAF
MTDIIMQIDNLTKEFQVNKHTSVTAIENISFTIKKGETFSLVGESGCGKTTLGRCVVRGISSSSGKVLYHQDTLGELDFLTVKGKQYKSVRKDIQMIFQDPFSSLNPRMTVYDIISEPLKAMTKLSKKEIQEKVKAIAEKTGLDVSYLKRYPHSFSGGQRQRIGIARALITNPKVIVCDEAVSALDVSIQAQIINLLKELQEEMDITYLFIAHDLSIVEHISDRVAVMYLGRIVELSTTDKLFTTPKHPYTEALLSAVPKPDPEIKKERIVLKGEVPNPTNRPSGCHFHPRCSYATEVCQSEQPPLVEIQEEHFVACHHAKEMTLQGIMGIVATEEKTLEGR